MRQRSAVTEVAIVGCRTPWPPGALSGPRRTAGLESSGRRPPVVSSSIVGTEFNSYPRERDKPPHAATAVQSRHRQPPTNCELAQSNKRSCVVTPCWEHAGWFTDRRQPSDSDTYILNALGEVGRPIAYWDVVTSLGRQQHRNGGTSATHLDRDSNVDGDYVVPRHRLHPGLLQSAHDVVTQTTST
jgi:hypothetical protein